MSADDESRAEPPGGYGFAFGVRGKYFHGVAEESGTARVKAWAPLFGFPGNGLTNASITDHVSLVPEDSYHGYESDSFRRFLSAEELEECRAVDRWLLIDQPLRDGLSTRVRMNSFLLALWLAKPTRTYVPFRFEEIDGGERTASRVIDRFQWIEGHVVDDLCPEDFGRIHASFPVLLAIYGAGRRLRNALVLTFRAQVSTDWQSSYICFSAAAEALLSHARGQGVATRLAEIYSRLTSSSDRQRKARRDHFKYLYAIRSEIMHGRGHDRNTGESNLKDLAAMRDVVREIWNRIVDSDDVRAALDSDDARRVNLFNAL